MYIQFLEKAQVKSVSFESIVVGGLFTIEDFDIVGNDAVVDDGVTKDTVFMKTNEHPTIISQCRGILYESGDDIEIGKATKVVDVTDRFTLIEQPQQ